VIAEIQVSGEVMTPASGLAPTAWSAACRDAVPELNDNAYRLPVKAAKASSTPAMAGPRLVSDSRPVASRCSAAARSPLPYLGSRGKRQRDPDAGGGPPCQPRTSPMVTGTGCFAVSAGLRCRCWPLPPAGGFNETQKTCNGLVTVRMSCGAPAGV